MASLPTISSPDSTAGTVTYYWYASNRSTLLTSGTTKPTAAMKTWAPGTYYVKAVVAESGGYAQAESSLMPFTVSPRTATLKWGARSFDYDGASHVPTCAVSNLVNGDSCTVTVGGEQTEVGNGYTATATSLSNNRYVLPSSRTTTFDIQAVINPTVSIEGWTYGDSPNTPVVSDNLSGGAETLRYHKAGATTWTNWETKAPSDAGDYVLEADVAASNGFAAATTPPVTFTISPAELTVKADPASKSYGSTDPTFTYTATGFKNGDTTSVFTGKISRAAGEDVGTYAQTQGTLSAGGNYTISFTGDELTITPADLTITANDVSITYGDPTPTNPGVTYSGLANGDSASALSGTLSYACSYNRYDNVGTFDITPSGLSSANYNITFKKGTLTVGKRKVTLTWSAPNSFTYSGSEFTWPAPAVGNTVNGDTLTAVWAEASGDATDKATDAGDYKPKVASLTGDNAGNYDLPDSVEGSWSIAAATTNNMTVSIAGWTYGKWSNANKPIVTAEHGTAAIAYYTDNGGALGDLVTDLDANGVPKNAGNYWVVATIAETANYPKASAQCAFTVSKANITITADDKQSLLNDDLVQLTYTIAGDFVTADESDLKTYYIDLHSDAVKNPAGSYPITVKKAEAPEHPNYNITYIDGTYTVTRAIANVEATGWTGTYDGTDTGKGITVSVTAADGINTSNVHVYYSTTDFSGMITEDEATALKTATETGEGSDFKKAFDKLNAAVSGSATTSPTFKDAGTHRVFFVVVADDVKCDVLFGYKDVVINKAQLTVTAKDKSIQYGEKPDNNGVEYSGFVTGEDYTVLKGELEYDYGTYSAGEKPGMYPITPKGLEADNYEITYVPGTLTVGPKELELEWPEDDEFTYNGASQTYGPATLKGLPSGAKVQVDMGGTTSATDAGSYIATVTGISGDDASNYTLAPSTVYSHTWSIKPADLTIKANDNTIVYGAVPADNGVTYEGLKGGDTAASLSGSLTYTHAYNQYDSAGDYKITPLGLWSPNYNISYEDGTLTVEKRELSLDWPAPTELNYTGSELTYGAPTLGNIVNGDDVSIDVYSGNKGTTGGLYTAKVDSIKGGKAGNYKLPDPATNDWSIIGATNSVSVSISDWIYGDPASAPTATDTGGVNSYTYEYSSDSSTGPWTPWAPAPTDAGTYWVKATVDATTYFDSAEDVASFEIQPREIGLSWTNLAFKYDGNQHVPTATATNVVGTDTCNVTVDGEKTEGGLHTATATALDNPNYKLPANLTQLFTIAPEAVTITALDNEITYGDAPSGTGVTYSGLLDGDKNADGTPKAGIFTGTLAYTYDYDQYDNVGDYTVTPTGLSSSSYAITYESGKLKVNPREVTLTWSTPDSFPYTGSEISWPEPTVGNTVNGDALTAVWATPSGTATDKATDVGTYSPEVGSLTGTKADNYKLPDAKTGSWEIAALPANKVTVRMTDWTYGKYSASANGPFATADYGTPTFSYYKDDNGSLGDPVTDLDSNGVPKNVGEYWVKAEVTAGPGGSYEAASATCKFSVTKAAITVTADDQVAVRNNTSSINSLTYTISGDVASWDNSSIQGYFEATQDSTSPINPAAAGVYTIKANWVSSYDATALPNYDVTLVDGTYTVTRAIANVSASGYTGTYDGVEDNERITVTVNDTATGTTYNGTGTGAITVYYSETDFTDVSEVGSATLNTLQTESDASSDNFKNAWSSLQGVIDAKGYATSAPVYKNAGTHRVYFMVVSDQTTPDIVVGYKDVVINKGQLTVTAGNKSIPIGSTAADGGYTIIGFVNGETESGLKTMIPPKLTGTVLYGYGTYTMSSPAGNYPINPTGLAADNYDISYVPGTLSVTVIPLTLDWSTDDSFMYDGTEKTYATPTLVGLPAGEDVQVEMTPGTDKATNGGTYTATVARLKGSDAAKYTLSGVTSHQWKITPAPLAVRAKDNTIVYGDVPAGAGVDFSGFKGSDSESSLTGSLSYTYGYVQCGDVGDYPSAITPGGFASPNYTIVYLPGRLTVTPRPLTLTWDDDDVIEYTGTTITYPKPTLGGIVAGDDVFVDEYEGNTGITTGTYTAEAKTFGGSKLRNYTPPTSTDDLTHDWKIKGADNAATVFLEDWNYGEEPNEPDVEADFGDDTATFTYASAKDGPYVVDVPTNVGTYWVKASIPAGDNYEDTEALATFQIHKRLITVSALPQGVAIGDDIKTGPERATIDDPAEGDKLAGVTLTTDPATPTSTTTFTGKITPSNAVIKNDAREDVTANYEIEYEDALMVVQPGGATIANDKVIWAMHRIIWLSVPEATELCEAEDRDDQIVEMADAHSCYTEKLPDPTWPDDELGISVIDYGGFEPVVGTYNLTLKANPELGVTAHVYDNSSSNPDTGVKVFANDTKPLRSILRAAKDGDRDAIATLIKIAEATAVDTDGNPIDVVDIDLSSVDPENPSTYMAVYLTADGDSVQAQITVSEDDDEATPGDEDGDKDKPDGGDDDSKGDNPDGDKDGSGKGGNKGGKDSDDGKDKGDNSGKDGNGSGKGGSGKGSNSSSDDETDGDGLAGLLALTGDDAAAHIVALALVAILAAGALLFSYLRRRDEE